MDWQNFNINEKVKVKLTDVGRVELLREAEVFRTQYPSVSNKYELPKEDNEGFTEWQLWCLMGSLGHLCTMGGEPPFEIIIKISLNELK